MTKLICTVCPRGCHMTVEGEVVTGNSCPRGAAFALAEATHPQRVLTATVAFDSAIAQRLPVRTAAPIPRELLLEGMNALRSIRLSPPITVGQVIDKDFLGTGVALIATRTMEK